MQDHWQSGLSDIQRTLAEPAVLDRPSFGQGLVAHDIHRPAR